MCSSSTKVRTVLLMGETGAGKSTFINYLTNYFGKGSLNSLKVKIPNRFYREPTEKENACHSEVDPTNPTISQTRDCNAYTFRGDRATYRFIDTPGFSDTSNSDVDVSKKILSAVIQARSLQAIVLVINGTHSRLTDSIRNALEQIAGNYPTTLRRNMLVVFTNCSAASKNFEESKLPISPRHIFYMNNSAFSFDQSQFDKLDESEQKIQSLNWQQAMRQIHELLTCIEKLNGKSTEVFRKMLESRSDLTSQVKLAIKEIQKQADLARDNEKLSIQIAELTVALSSKEGLVPSLDQAIQSSESQQNSQAAERKKAENEKRGIPQYGAGINGEQYMAAANLRAVLEKRCDAHVAEENRLQKLKEDALKQKREVEMSISSIKQQLGANRALITKNESKINDSKQQQAAAQVQIENQCLQLRRICKNFDFQDELHATIASLHTEISLFRTTESRQAAEVVVQMMSRLSEALNG